MMETNELEAGREMDALIAEKVMGWTRSDPPLHAKVGLLSPPIDDERFAWAAMWDERGLPHWLPTYSTDIAAAWQVVEKFWKVDVEKDGAYEVYGCQIRAGVTASSHYSEADTAPLAICRAALKAVSQC